MKPYIALLRGINVSGQKKILMKDLKIIFQKLKFVEVTTYIQSGNVVFKTKINQKLLANLISKEIEKIYDFYVPVIIIAAQKIKAIITNNPFLEEKVDTKKLYVSYLSDSPKNTKKLDDFDFGKDQYIIENDVIYLKYDLGAGNTKLSNKTIETKLQLTATCRNWRTSCKLLELIEALDK
jgi:uncharacterized protein (DUF1697 family)